MATKKLKKLSRQKLAIFIFCFASIALNACTMSASRYGMVSTKSVAVFSLEERDRLSVTSLSNQSIPMGETKLDSLVKPLAVEPDTRKYALIIGVKNYKQQAEVNYADNSAQTFALTAKNVLGVPPENVILLLNDDATSGQIKTKILLLAELAEPGDSLYVFFAGHGVPDRDGNTYILPADMSADSIHLEPQLMLDKIYETLARSPAARIHVFVDSCFSGKDDEGKLLFAGVAPVFKQKIAEFSSEKLTVMTAGGPSDFANQYTDEQQRMFSYFLIKGLVEQKEDINALYEYVRLNVKRASLRLGLGYKQIPQLHISE